MKTTKFTCMMAAAALLLASCGSKKGSSYGTGWAYNNTQWGGFEVSSNTEQATAPGLVFIEGGSFVMGHVAEDTRYTWDNVAHAVTITSFYMDETEVSNVLYREFIYWMQRTYGEEYPEMVAAMMPDTAAWRDKLGWRESMVENYFRMANFNDYPVVGVSWEQASQFCRWRTDRVNEKVLIDLGMIELDQENLNPSTAFQTDVYLAGQYGGEIRKQMPDLNPAAGGEERPVNKADGILFPYYRLPTEAEWEFAALGLIGNTYDERMTEHKTYPWTGQSLRSANKKYYGQFLANFKRSRGDAMGVAGNLNDGWEYTCPVKWYFPNDYGLYNMAGNVSEWCMDVYRKTPNPSGGSDLNPFRGNVYKTALRDEDGMIMPNDTGLITYQEVAPDMNRLNYRQANNINYLDGDYNSNIEQSSWRSYDNTSKDGGDDDEMANEDSQYDNNDTGIYGDEGDGEEGDGENFLRGDDSLSNLMYNRITNDQKNNPTSSLISNRVRVVKGGNWTDRAYYLQAATRRYYDQDKATAWIGFRCAMDRVGSTVR